MNKSSLLMQSLVLAGMFNNTKIRQSDPLAGIDIKKEYELIKQKKSGLSANDRRMVVRRYEQDKERRSE